MNTLSQNTQHNPNISLFNKESLFVVLLFGSMGAITWAIRGTAGWGGVDGTVIPGLMWGLLWYYISKRKGIDARGIVLWLGLGIALGGELGYGQYTGWIQGKFSFGNEVIAINPLLGYFWFAMCGIGWGAPGGIILGWALGKNVSDRTWIVRALTLAALLMVLFTSPMIDWFKEILLKFNSGILFPNIDLGIYTEIGEHLSRTVYTNTQNFLAVVWWGLALLVAFAQKDKTTVTTGLIIGGGFGIGFLQSAIWALGYSYAPEYIDWWKIWELNSGFNLGVLYAIVLVWTTRKFHKKHKNQMQGTDLEVAPIEYAKWQATLFLALAGFVLLYFVGFEYFWGTGLALSLFYFIAICFSWFRDGDPNAITERRKNIMLVFSIFYLVFLLLHGGSERFGIVFNLYELDEVSQYSWPIERIWIFVPFAVFTTVIALIQMRKVLQNGTNGKLWAHKSGLLTARITDLMTFTTFIGVLSIWPAKISIFYAFFLIVALYALNRFELASRN